MCILEKPLHLVPEAGSGAIAAIAICTLYICISSSIISYHLISYYYTVSIWICDKSFGYLGGPAVKARKGFVMLGSETIHVGPCMSVIPGWFTWKGTSTRSVANEMTLGDKLLDWIPHLLGTCWGFRSSLCFHLVARCAYGSPTPASPSASGSKSDSQSLMP